MKKKRYEAEGAKEYREANKRIQKVKKAMEDLIGAQCEEIETYLNKTNNKGADQLVKVVIVVVLLFYVHGKHLRLCRDGQST